MQTVDEQAQEARERAITEADRLAEAWRLKESITFADAPPFRVQFDTFECDDGLHTEGSISHAYYVYLLSDSGIEKMAFVKNYQKAKGICCEFLFLAQEALQQLEDRKESQEEIGD